MSWTQKLRRSEGGLVQSLTGEKAEAAPAPRAEGPSGRAPNC